MDFVNDRPDDPLSAIEFINVDNLNGQLDQDGEPITFSIVDGKLVGQVNGIGPAVITIEFTAAVNGAGGTVTYSYLVTLGGPVDHDFGDQIEGFVLLEGIEVQVTDSNGDTGSATFTGTIWDDVPSADDTDTVPSNTDTATGNVITGGYHGRRAAPATTRWAPTEPR